MLAGTDNAYELAKKYKIKTAFGTDVLFSQALAQRQGAMLAKLTRWYTPAEALVMATGTNAELLGCPASAAPIPASSAWSRKAHSPISCSSTATRSRTSSSIADPAKNFVVIMKDGKIYKNTLPR